MKRIFKRYDIFQWLLKWKEFEERSQISYSFSYAWVKQYLPVGCAKQHLMFFRKRIADVVKFVSFDNEEMYWAINDSQIVESNGELIGRKE